jgi:RNA polymerase sigma-70 factor (ECF subfamily)
MAPDHVTTLLAAVERCRKRLWAHCYRMTGRRSDADDLSQEAIARALERADDLRDGSTADGWLFRIATTVCLDHLRRARRTRARTELVDPVVFDDLPAPPADPAGPEGPEGAVILRDDVRLAVVAALQHLSPKQRAALLLNDVCGMPLADVASTIGTNGNAAKAALHRARLALDRARGRVDVDLPVDRDLVEQLARALESRSVEALAALLADDVWGVVDGGGVVRVASRPTFGARTLVRRFANLSRRVPVPVACRVVALNGEPAVLVTIPSAGDAVFASVHVETRDGRIVAMRVVRDPMKLAPLQETLQ